MSREPCFGRAPFRLRASRIPRPRFAIPPVVARVRLCAIFAPLSPSEVAPLPAAGFTNLN